MCVCVGVEKLKNDSSRLFMKQQRLREADLNTFTESTVSSPIIPKCLRLTWRPLNLSVFPVKWFGCVVVDDPKGGIQKTLQQSKSCCWRLFSGLKIDKTIHHWRRDCGESTWRWQCSTCRFPKKVLSLSTPAWVLPTRKVPSTMLISNRCVACSNDRPNKVAKNNAALSCMEATVRISCRCISIYFLQFVVGSKCDPMQEAPTN